MKRKMGFLKVSAKLVTAHWKSHLLYPFIVALLVEPAWGGFWLKDQSIAQFVFSREGLVSHLSIVSIIITYLVVTAKFLREETKASWTDVSGEQLKEALSNAATSLRLAQFPWNSGSSLTLRNISRT